MRDVKDFLLVPVELCEVIIRNHWSKTAAVWLALKAISEGQIKLENKVTRELASLVGYKSKKSIYNQIDKLIALNWMGRDLNGWYYIRAFRKVKKQLGITSKTAAEFNPESDLSSCKEFFFSASVGSLVKRREVARSNKKGSSTSGDIKEEIPGVTYGPGNLSVSFLANYFNVSKSKITKLKRGSIEAGYLDTAGRFAKNSSMTHPYYTKFYDETFSQNPFQYSGNNYMRLTDEIDPNIRFKTRRFDY